VAAAVQAIPRQAASVDAAQLAEVGQALRVQAAGLEASAEGSLGAGLRAVTGLEPEQVQAAAMQAGGAVASAAGEAAAATVAPFDVFQGAWLLNFLLVGTITLLAYGLIIIAPKK
jgi:hypothetical protein